jgi:hypothetical protein
MDRGGAVDPDSFTLSALVAFFASIPRPRRLSPAAAGLNSFQRFAPLASWLLLLELVPTSS